MRKFKIKIKGGDYKIGLLIERHEEKVLNKIKDNIETREKELAKLLSTVQCLGVVKNMKDLYRKMLSDVDEIIAIPHF